MPSRKPQKINVLLIEDDAEDRWLTEQAFQATGLPYHLAVAKDGQEALAYLKNEPPFQDAATAPPPHLVLLDLNLPRLDGAEVLQRMKSDPATACIPVIVFTTSSDQHEIQRTYSLCASSFITKPAAFDEFQRMVGDLARYWYEVASLPAVPCV